MKCVIEINMNHDSFHPDWQHGIAKIMSTFCSKLSVAGNEIPQKFKLLDHNGVTVGTAHVTEEDMKEE